MDDKYIKIPNCDYTSWICINAKHIVAIYEDNEHTCVKTACETFFTKEDLNSVIDKILDYNYLTTK